MALIGATMIARGAATTLPACLDSIKDYVDPIVIVLAGTPVDDTEGIARQYTPYVYPFEGELLPDGGLALQRQRHLSEPILHCITFTRQPNGGIIVDVIKDAPNLRCAAIPHNSSYVSFQIKGRLLKSAVLHKVPLQTLCKPPIACNTEINAVVEVVRCPSACAVLRLPAVEAAISVNVTPHKMAQKALGQCWPREAIGFAFNNSVSAKVGHQLGGCDAQRHTGISADSNVPNGMCSVNAIAKSNQVVFVLGRKGYGQAVMLNRPVSSDKPQPVRLHLILNLLKEIVVASVAALARTAVAALNPQSLQGLSDAWPRILKLTRDAITGASAFVGLADVTQLFRRKWMVCHACSLPYLATGQQVVSRENLHA